MVNAANSSVTGRLASVAGNLGWLLASNGLMAALSIIYIGIASRTLGIVDFGRFALITGAAQTLATVFSFETWKVVVHYGVHHEAEGQHSAKWRMQKAAAAIDFISGGVGILAAVGLYSFACEWLGLSKDIAPFALGYAIIQLATLRSAPTGILRLLNRFDLAAIADSTTSVGRFIGAGAALLFSPTIQGFLIAWAAAEILTTAIYWAFVHRAGALRDILETPMNWRAVERENKGLSHFLWSTNLQSTLGLASRQAPLLLVGGMAGPAAAGGFRLALQLANALSKLSLLLTRAAFPEVVRSIRSVPRHRLAGLVGRIAASCLAGGLIAMLVVVISGRAFLGLVGGESFGAAYGILLWLAGAACIEIAAASFEPILLTVHRAGTAMIARALAVLLQFAVMAALLPSFGAIGAAMSVCAGALCAAFFLGFSLFRYAKTHEPS